MESFFSDTDSEGDGGFDRGETGFGQTQDEQTCIAAVGTREDEAALRQAVDDAFDGGSVHRSQTAEMVLRAGADFVELGEGGELRGGQTLGNARGKNGGVALVGLAQEKTNLLFENVFCGSARNRAARFAGSFARRFSARFRAIFLRGNRDGLPLAP